VRISNES